MSHKILISTENEKVGIQYRVASLAFLYFDTEDVPGNAGIRDQVLAMEWVQDNIGMFGGNPDLVTVYGQSAGSFSSTYHLMSPLTK